MSFAEFFARIQSPALQQIASHWRDARGQRLMPAWKQIDPRALAPHLPIVWAWRYDRASDRFTGRLAGDAITQIFGRQLRGMELGEFFAGRDPEAVAARYRLVVGGPSLMYCEGQVFRLAGRIGIGERIAMPLAEDGLSPDGIFGATTYSVPHGLYREAPNSERFDQQQCHFFGLETETARAAATSLSA